MGSSLVYKDRSAVLSKGAGGWGRKLAFYFNNMVTDLAKTG